MYDPPPLKTMGVGGRGEETLPKLDRASEEQRLTQQSTKYPYKCHILPSPTSTLPMSALQLLAHHRQILCPHRANYEFLSH